jgi:hypothetical protein
MSHEPQATWKRPLQEFKTWIRRERVTASQGECTTDLEDFVPAGEVEAYLSESGRLRAIIAALFPNGYDDTETRKIKRSYSIVLAILVSIDHGEYIDNFLPYDFLCDTRLPFTERPRKFPIGRGTPDTLFERFQRAQVRFCAAKFTRGHHIFEAEERLPFLERTFVGQGGSAKVYRVKIHTEHDSLREPPSQVRAQSPSAPIEADGHRPGSPEGHKLYALKVYDDIDGRRWHGIETAMFKKLHRTGLDDAHIIGYYCSYEHRGVCHALLEFADLGTLKHFMMRKESAPPSTDEEILCFWEYILHVTGAIGEIHDIDPDNEGPVKFIGYVREYNPMLQEVDS